MKEILSDKQYRKLYNLFTVIIGVKKKCNSICYLFYYIYLLLLIQVGTSLFRLRKQITGQLLIIVSLQV